METENNLAKRQKEAYYVIDTSVAQAKAVIDQAVAQVQRARQSINPSPLTPTGEAQAAQGFGPSPNTPTMHTFASGAKSTVVKPRYDLVPAIAIELIAERLAYGASRHGERNYLQGASDPRFIRDRKNHMAEHLLAYLRYGKRTDLSALLCNAAMLADLGAFVNDRQVTEGSYGDSTQVLRTERSERELALSGGPSPKESR